MSWEGGKGGSIVRWQGQKGGRGMRQQVGKGRRVARWEIGESSADCLGYIPDLEEIILPASLDG